MRWSRNGVWSYSPPTRARGSAATDCDLLADASSEFSMIPCGAPRMAPLLPRHTPGTRETGAPETIRTSDLCRRSYPPAPTEQIKARCRCGRFGLCSPQAPVAQLDRALPSEGKGRTFESSRARHSPHPCRTISRSCVRAHRASCRNPACSTAVRNSLWREVRRSAPADRRRNRSPPAP